MTSPTMRGLHGSLLSECLRLPYVACIMVRRRPQKTVREFEMKKRTSAPVTDMDPWRKDFSAAAVAARKQRRRARAAQDGDGSR